jgi:hypothetical protein
MKRTHTSGNITYIVNTSKAAGIYSYRMLCLKDERVVHREECGGFKERSEAHRAGEIAVLEMIKRVESLTNERIAA